METKRPRGRKRSDLEEIIRKQKDQIKSWEIKNSGTQLSDEIKELRHLALMTHIEIETILDWALTVDVGDFKKRATEEELDRYSIIMYKMYVILERRNFYNKLGLAKELKIISDGTYEIFEKLNKLRNLLAHKNIKALKLFDNRNKYLDTLGVISTAHYAADQLWLFSKSA